MELLKRLHQIRGATHLIEGFLARGDDAEVERELLVIERQIKAIRRERNPKPSEHAGVVNLHGVRHATTP